MARHSGRSWALEGDHIHPDEKRIITTKFLQQALGAIQFAYGQRYLNGSGEMALIYPKHSRFSGPISEFDFGNQLALHVLPFDLELGKFVRSPEFLSNNYDLASEAAVEVYAH